jgi:hypothetical protein
MLQVFNLAEKRLDDTNFFATPASTKIASEATSSPLASSSKANQLPVPPPFLDPNTVIPPTRLIRRSIYFDTLEFCLLIESAELP